MEELAIVARDIIIAIDKLTATIAQNNHPDWWNQLVNTVPVIVTSVMAIIGSILIANRRNRFDGITQNRMEWISKVRRISAKLVQFEIFSADESNDVDYSKLKKDFVKAAESLLLYLNVSGAIDQVVALYINRVVRNFPTFPLEDEQKSEFQRTRRELLLAIQIYLKAEWERVKMESKGRKINEEKKILEIIDSFSNQYESVRTVKERYLRILCNENIGCKTCEKNIEYKKCLTFNKYIKDKNILNSKKRSNNRRPTVMLYTDFISSPELNPSDKTPQPTHQPPAADRAPTELADS